MLPHCHSHAPAGQLSGRGASLDTDQWCGDQRGVSMDSRHRSRHATQPANFQDKFYHDYPSYRKEERRDGRAKLRRSDSGHSRHRGQHREPGRSGRDPSRAAVRRFSSQQPGSSSSSRARLDQAPSWRPPGPDRRRWGWAGAGAGEDLDLVTRQHQSIRTRLTNDYVEMSSMDTSSSGSSASSLLTISRGGGARWPGGGGGGAHQVSRSRSISRPSPPRAKSVGNYPVGPSRTHSFTSIYETRSSGGGGGGGYYKGGTSLDLRPLRTSLSSQGIFFTETGHLPRQSSSSYDMDGPLSISLQDLQSSAFTR